MQKRDKVTLGIKATKLYYTTDDQSFESYPKAMKHQMDLNRKNKLDDFLVEYHAGSDTINFIRRHYDKLRAL